MEIAYDAPVVAEPHAGLLMLLVAGTVAVLLVVAWRSATRRSAAQGLPTWYRTALWVIFGIFALGILAIALLVAAGIDLGRNSVFWAGFVAAMVGLASLMIGRFADVMTRRNDDLLGQLRLALALYAEIHSNLRQTRAVTTLDLAAKRLQLEARGEGSSAEPPAPAPSGAPAAAETDVTQPFFDRATEHYDKIPSHCIVAVVEYYNLNGMIETSLEGLRREAIGHMTLARRFMYLHAHFALVSRTDVAGTLALRQLRDEIDDMVGLLDLKPIDFPDFEAGAFLYPEAAVSAIIERYIIPAEGAGVAADERMLEEVVAAIRRAMTGSRP